MQEHLNKRVDEVIRLANEAAREYEQEYVGTEHILLGILREGTGLGARLLALHGLTEEKVRPAIDKLVKASLEDTWVFGRLPGSPHFINVMATAIEEARGMESREVRTEHLLLALLKEKRSVAYEVLRSCGLKSDDIRRELAEMAGEA